MPLRPRRRLGRQDRRPHRAESRKASARSVTVILLLMGFAMINFVDKSVIGLAAAPMMAELGLSAAQYGTIAGSFYFLFSLSGIAFGFLGNRISARWLLAGLAVTWSVAQLPVALPAVGLTVILATRVLLGAGEGPALPLALHTAFTWVPDRNRGFAASLLTIASALGGILGTPLLTALIGAQGWRAAFGVLGVAGLVWAVVWLVRGGEGPHVLAQVRSGPRLPYRRLLSTGTWLGTLAAGFAISWALAVAIAFLPLYLEQAAGYRRDTIGFLAALPSIAACLLMLLGGTLSQRLIRRGRSSRLALGVLGSGFTVIAGLSLLALPRVEALALLGPLIGLAFGAGTAQTPLSAAAIAEITPVGQRSAVLGLWYALVSIAAVIAPILTGLVVDAAATKAAGYTLAFDVTGGLLLAGGLAAALLIRPDRDAASLT